MKIPSFLDPLAPFKTYIAIGLVLLLLAGLGYGAKVMYDKGHTNGVNSQIAANQKENARLNGVIAKKNTSLRDAAVALRAASNAFNAVKAQADLEVAKAKEAQSNAESGAAAANLAAAQLRTRIRDAEAKAGRARGKSDACAALLDFDVVAERSRLGCDK